jgi:hypothetical protein
MRPPTLLALLFACLALVLAALPAFAQPFIPPGREQQVLALFAPYTLGGPVADGFSLRKVAIEGGTIRILLLGAQGATAEARLEPRRDAPEGSRSFRFVRSPDEGAAAHAFDALLARVQENDRGDLYPPAAAPRFTRAVYIGLAAALLVLGLAGALWRRRKPAS